MSAGSRTTPSGDVLRWRSAGLEQAVEDPALPFFIEWGRDAPLPGRTPLTHPAGPVELARLLLEGDPDRFAMWLADQQLPVVVGQGEPAVKEVVLLGIAGEIVLGAP